MTDTTITCMLCGFRFDPTQVACHTSCPMSSGCHILCCPNCGYQVPDETRMGLTSALRRLLTGHGSRKLGEEQ
jgi:hypothetical protein